MLFNGSGSILAVADSLYQINLLSVKNSLQMIGKLQGHSDVISTCVFTSEERRQMISVAMDRTLRIWDLKSKKPVKSPSIASVALALDVSNSDSCFATGHKSGDIKVWSLTEQKEIGKIAHAHAGQIACLKYTPDGSMIVSASRTNGVIVHDAR